MRKKLAASVGTIALTATAIALPITSATAEPINDFYDFYGFTTDSQWIYEIEDDLASCESLDIELYRLTEASRELVDESLYSVTISAEDGTATVDISQVPSGGHDLILECNDPDNSADDELYVDFNRFTVDKVVEGDYPNDAMYTIDFSCLYIDRYPGDEFETQERTELTFAAAGGSQDVYLVSGWPAEGEYESVDCTVTETANGGAENTSISGGEFSFDSFADRTITVTNTFPEAVADDEVTQDEETAPEPDPTDEEAAPAVIRQPAFTG